MNMNYASTPGIARGCGHRTEGGVYLETGTGVFGDTPIWQFISDQPIPYTAPHTLGIDVVKLNGVHHVVNHVGSKYWPCPSDFIEEGLRWGFSTKVPKTQDLSILTSKSRIIHVHTLGALTNPNSLGKWVVPEEHAQRCAFHRKTCFHPAKGVGDYFAAKAAEAELINNEALYTKHVLAPRRAYTNRNDLPATGCNFYHWAFAQPTLMEVWKDDVMMERFEADELVRIWERTDPERSPSIFRDLANTHTLKFFRDGNTHGTNRYRVYPIFARNPNYTQPVWASAMIAALPLTNIAVIKAADGTHLKTLASKQAEAGTTFHVTETEA